MLGCRPPQLTCSLSYILIFWEIPPRKGIIQHCQGQKPGISNALDD